MAGWLAIDHFDHPPGRNNEPINLDGAAQLWGAAEGWLEAHRHATDPHDSLRHAMRKVQTQLGDQVYKTVWAAGRDMTFEQAINFALAVDGGINVISG